MKENSSSSTSPCLWSLTVARQRCAQWHMWQGLKIVPYENSPTSGHSQGRLNNLARDTGIPESLIPRTLKRREARWTTHQPCAQPGSLEVFCADPSPIGWSLLIMRSAPSSTRYCSQLHLGHPKHPTVDYCWVQSSGSNYSLSLFKHSTAMSHDLPA